MLLVVLVCSLSLATTGQEADNDWIDPHDMLNYAPRRRGTLQRWITVANIQLWSTMSWLMQFWRLFGVSFFISIFWNWLYLYKIAFADHQRKIAKMYSLSERCSGLKKIDWIDSLKEWYRTTWTLQDDPCKEYYETILIHPLLLVSPLKAIIYTMTTFITEPLKQIGQGISEFLVALLKDLPITLQIPVLLTIVFAIVVCIYVGVPAAFQHGVAAPFRRLQGDPPPPQLEQPQPGGDAQLQVVEGRLRSMRQSRISAESDSENLHETQEEL